VKDTSVVALENSFDHLAEKVFRHSFWQSASFSDKVEKIRARFHSLHNDDEHVCHVASVQQLDYAATLRHLTHQTKFEWNFDAIHLF
jgi:iron-sulfur cluster repair protein YtfE (RIC family)